MLNTTVDAGSTQALLDLNLNTTPDNTEAYLDFIDSKGDFFVSVSGIASAKTDPTIAFLYDDTPVAFGTTIDNTFDYIGVHPADLVPADGASGAWSTSSSMARWIARSHRRRLPPFPGSRGSWPPATCRS